MKKGRYLQSWLVVLFALFFLSACSRNTDEADGYSIRFINRLGNNYEISIENGDFIARPADPTQRDNERVFSHWATHRRSTDGSEIFDFSVPFNSETMLLNPERDTVLTLHAHFRGEGHVTPNPMPSATTPETPIETTTTVLENVVSVDYVTLHSDTHNEFRDERVRISGRASNVSNNNFSFRDGIDGLTSNVYVTIANWNAFEVTDGDYVSVVGTVGMRVLGQLAFRDAVIENVGEDARLLHEELRTIAIRGAAEQQARELQELIDSAIVVTAIELAREYRENEVRANNRFRGNMVLVTGSIATINATIGNAVVIRLDDGETFSLTQPMFTFRDANEIVKIAELNLGDTVTILGESTGESLGTATINNSRFVE